MTSRYCLMPLGENRMPASRLKLTLPFAQKNCESVAARCAPSRNASSECVVAPECVVRECAVRTRRRGECVVSHECVVRMRRQGGMRRQSRMCRQGMCRQNASVSVLNVDTCTRVAAILYIYICIYWVCPITCNSQ